MGIRMCEHVALNIPRDALKCESFNPSEKMSNCHVDNYDLKNAFTPCVVGSIEPKNSQIQMYSKGEQKKRTLMFLHFHAIGGRFAVGRCVLLQGGQRERVGPEAKVIWNRIEFLISRLLSFDQFSLI